VARADAANSGLFPVQVPVPVPVPVPPADFLVPPVDLATTESANLLRAVALQQLYWTPRGCGDALLYNVLSLGALVTWSGLRSQIFLGADRGVLWVEGHLRVATIYIYILALSSSSNVVDVRCKSE
jgi:hypothetical protein